MWEPTRPKNGEGRRHWGTGGHTPRSDVNQWSHRGSGDGMSAEEIRRNTGSPERWGRDPNRTPVRARPGRPGWRTGPYDRGRRVMPAEGRGLSSRPAPEGHESREIGDEPTTSTEGSEAPGGVACQSEGIARLPLLRAV